MTIEDQVSAGVAKAMKELTAASSAELQAAQGLLNQAQDELNTAKANAEKLAAQVKDLAASNEKLSGEVKALTDAKAKLETDLAASNKRSTELEQKEQDIDKRAGLKAAAILQSRGIKEPLTEDAATDNPGSKGTESELTGLARVEQIFAQQLAARRNK